MATAISKITRRPHPDGSEACIRDTNIHVWGLVEWRKHGLSGDEILQAVQGLTQEDLDAAWEFYDANQKEIDEAIRLNAEA
jgi:uncharacterized protein (DUF433 family)